MSLPRRGVYIQHVYKSLLHNPKSLQSKNHRGRTKTQEETQSFPSEEKPAIATIHHSGVSQRLYVCVYLSCPLKAFTKAHPYRLALKVFLASRIEEIHLLVITFNISTPRMIQNGLNANSALDVSIQHLSDQVNAILTHHIGDP